VSIDRIPLPLERGALYLCARRDVADDPDAALAFAQAHAIACLLPIDELEMGAPEYLEWLRTNRAGKALWFPVSNYSAPGASVALPFLRMVEARLRAGEGVVMHCAAGQGRAGTMAVAVLMLLGVPRDEAVMTVRSHRVFAGPGTASQVNFVLDLEATLRAERG
jgi:protein-tyrosine phosphatase